MPDYPSPANFGITVAEYTRPTDAYREKARCFQQEEFLEWYGSPVFSYNATPNTEVTHDVVVDATYYQSDNPIRFRTTFLYRPNGNGQKNFFAKHEEMTSTHPTYTMLFGVARRVFRGTSDYTVKVTEGHTTDHELYDHDQLDSDSEVVVMRSSVDQSGYPEITSCVVLGRDPYVAGEYSFDGVGIAAIKGKVAMAIVDYENQEAHITGFSSIVLPLQSYSINKLFVEGKENNFTIEDRSGQLVLVWSFDGDFGEDIDEPEIALNSSDNKLYWVEDSVRHSFPAEGKGTTLRIYGAELREAVPEFSVPNFSVKNLDDTTTEGAPLSSAEQFIRDSSVDYYVTNHLKYPTYISKITKARKVKIDGATYVLDVFTYEALEPNPKDLPLTLYYRYLTGDHLYDNLQAVGNLRELFRVSEIIDEVVILPRNSNRVRSFDNY